ncbi:MAG: hypothetical protein WBM32_14600 [Crocosphaera sp.]
MKWVIKIKGCCKVFYGSQKFPHTHFTKTLIVLRSRQLLWISVDLSDVVESVPEPSTVIRV